MAPPNNRRDPRHAVSLLVRVAARDEEELAEKYATNISHGGVFLRTREPKPIGSYLRLEIRLADGTTAIRALGVVRFVQNEDRHARPPVSPGMGVQFVEIDDASRALVDRVCDLAARAEELPKAVVEPSPELPPSPPEPPRDTFAFPDEDLARAIAEAAAPDDAASQPLAPEAFATPDPDLVEERRAPPPPPADAVPARRPAAGAPPAPEPAPVAPAPAAGPPPAPAAKPQVPSSGPPHAARAAPAPETASASPAVAPPPLPPRAPPGVVEAPAPPPPRLGQVARSASGKPVVLDRAGLDLPGLDPAFEPRRDGPIIGIDLGTTYSCAAYVKNGKAVTLPSREGYATVPSILALNTRGKLVTGHPAKSQMQLNPRDTVYGSKRLVGRPFSSPVVSQIRERFFYEIVEGPRGEAAVELGGAVLTLQEVAALILKEVRDVAQNNLGREIHRAVITCPAYYNEPQREAVRQAGRLAGLHVERILNEPTAAALAFGYGKQLSRRVLVYDLGGGTFDASVLELHETVFEVISTGGDTFLGGVDFDNQLVDHLLAHIETATGQPFDGDRVALQRICDAAERAKCALSEQEEHRVHVPFITMIDDRPFDLDVRVTRAQVEELTLPLVERTIQVCRDVLSQKSLAPSDIDEIVLVGGMSRMPLVRAKLRELFGRDLHKGVHPDEAVALGAALLGHSLERSEGVVLIDVLPMSIGLGLPGGKFKPVVERNTSLPVTRTYGMATVRDDQTTIDVPVFQGESEKAAENEYLGMLQLSGLPKAPKGMVKVAVTFQVSPESILTVTARDLTTNRSADVVLSTRGTPDEVRRKLGLKAPSPDDAVAGLTASDGKAAGAKPSRMLGFFRKLFGTRAA